MKRVLTILTFLAITVASLSGHEYYRVVGTISRVTAHEIDVTDKDHKTLTLVLSSKRTVVKRNKEKAELPLSTLAVDQSVVIDAYGDSEWALEATDIRIVPPIRQKSIK